MKSARSERLDKPLERGHSIGVDAVAGALLLGRAENQAGVFQHLDVLRGRGRRQIDHIGQVVLERLEQRVAERRSAVGPAAKGQGEANNRVLGSLLLNGLVDLPLARRCPASDLPGISTR